MTAHATALGIALEALEWIAERSNSPAARHHAAATLAEIADAAADAWPTIHAVRHRVTGEPRCGSESPCSEPVRLMGHTPGREPVVLCTAGHYTAVEATPCP